MSETAAGGLVATALFFGTLALLEVGRRIRQHQRRQHGEGVGVGVGPVEGAAFGLMSLLLAFTFSGAASRFDSRRELIGAEANAIGTVYQRLDLLEPAARPALQQKLRSYVDARLALYHAGKDRDRVRLAQAQVAGLQREIWERAVEAVRSAPVPNVAVPLLPAVNEMTDAAATRAVTSLIHPPLIVYLLLGMVSLMCALMAGYSMGARESRSWLHMIGFAAVFAVTFYVIVDLEYPRLGLFRITEFDRVLVELRAGMR